MNRHFRLLVLLLLTSHFALAQQTNSRIIVKFKPTVNYTFDQKSKRIITANPALAILLNNSHILQITPLIPDIKSIKKKDLKSLELVQHIHFFDIDPAFSIPKIIENLQQSGMFQYVENDKPGKGSGVRGNDITSNDSYYNLQWGLQNNGTFNGSAIAGADVNMSAAWNITTGSSSTIVCILDTGLKLDHPEFAGRLWTNQDEIPGNNIDDDGNGYIDDINGWDWANNDANPTDDYGHDTNVAGIAAATGNNSIGYAGVNWKCKVMVGKILNSSNSGFYSWWISGIYYAVNNGAKVINMSVGGSSFDQASKDACDFAKANNVIIFACMMNENNNVTYYPAGFASTIAIGATDVNDHRVAPFFWSATSGSNYGAHIDLVAPGNYIYGLSYNSNTNYSTYWGGTSQATPLATGVGSLICALKPSVTVEEVRGILRSTAKDLVGTPGEDMQGWDQYMGAGRMDAGAAINSVYPCSASGFKFSSNLTGTSYQWQMNDGSGFVNISNNSNYSGTNAATLLVSNAPTSWYGYQYRCVVGGNNGAVSTIKFTAYWIGGISTAWENAANWACGVIPDGNTDVIINNGNPNFPQVSSNASCRSTTVSKNVSIKINAGFGLLIKH